MPPHMSKKNAIESLAQAEDPIRQDFFDGISTEGYTLTLAKEDQQTVSGGNATLLEEYITYLADLASQHDSCGFDVVVTNFEEYNGKQSEWEKTGWSSEQEYLNSLFNSLLGEGITPDQIEQWGCDNEYVEPFINWCNNGYRFNEEPAAENRPLTPEEFEEYRRGAQERLRESQERDRQAAAEAREGKEERLSYFKS